MKKIVKKSSDSKCDTLNQMFVINQLANQAYNEIYKRKADPWDVYRQKCKMMYQIKNPLSVYQLYQQLYCKLELPKKQVVARHLN